VAPPDPSNRASGFDALYGLELLELQPEFGRARLVIRDDHKQPLGVVHGGVYASIAEALSSHATATASPDGVAVFGVSNQTSFLRPAREGTLHATAVRKHAGRTTWVWEVEIADDDGRLCALSRMTIALRALT
jgi:uncharacterized protein (TIGR00369 family)